MRRDHGGWWVLAGVAAALATPGVAHAGAWTQPQGHGQVIITAEGKFANDAFDDEGAPRSSPHFDKAEFAAYFEYGLVDRLTVIVAPRFIRSSMDPPTDQTSSGFGHTELGARYLLARFDPAAEGFWRGSVVSVQGSALVPGSVSEIDPLLGEEALAEYDLRLLWGTAFASGGWTGYLDLQAGYRLLEGSDPDEVRVDATLGLRPRPDVTLMAQAFLVSTVEPGTPQNPDGWYLRGQIGAVYDIDARWSVQAAVNQVLAGRNALAETGGLLGIWHRF
jgi:hypothetical protein